MTMGRKAFISSTAIGLGSLIAGCSPMFGGGGGGTKNEPADGPTSAAEVLRLAKVAPAPDGTEPTMTDATVPDGYQWGREVTFDAPTAGVDQWLTGSFGAADAAARFYALSPTVAEAFDVTDVPDTWRSLSRSVEGTRLDLMLLINDQDPSTVRLHVRERAD